MKGDKELTKRSLDLSFEKQLRAKNLMCKLPIVNMRDNHFRYGGAEQRGATLFDHNRSVHNHSSISNRSARKRSVSRKRDDSRPKARVKKSLETA